MSRHNEQPGALIRIGSPEARRRILEEETGPSFSSLTTVQVPVSPFSVEVSELSEDSLSEGSTPKKDSFPPEDSVPMEGSSPPQDSFLWKEITLPRIPFLRKEEVFRCSSPSFAIEGI
ncbi:hypothetical protein P9112_009563 [Eukaryota sp. TZLM1-RC]